MKSISTSLQFVLLATNGTGFTWNHLQKLVASLLILSVMGCGSIKGDNQASSTEPGLPKLYTSTDILIGDYLGTTDGAYGLGLVVRFPDGVWGVIDFQTNGAGYTGQVGVVVPIQYNFSGGPSSSCYYNSIDCSGDCLLAVGGSVPPLKNAIIGLDEASFFYYTGKEAVQILSQNFSVKSFNTQYYIDPNEPPYPSSGSSCTHTVGPIATPISVIKPSRWTPPNGLTFPITGVSLR